MTRPRNLHKYFQNFILNVKKLLKFKIQITIFAINIVKMRIFVIFFTLILTYLILKIVEIV